MGQSTETSFIYRSPDLDSFKAVVAGCLAPFSLRPEEAGAYRPELRHARLDSLSLTSICYGDRIEIDSQLQGDFYLLQVPLRGSFGVIDDAGGCTTFESGAAHFVTPSERLRMRWSPNCRQLVIRFDQDTVDDLLSAFGERAPFEEQTRSISLETPRGSALNRYIHFLLREIETDADFADDTLISVQHARALFAMMNAALQEEAAPPPRNRTWAAPYYVKRAEDFIAAHLDEPIGIAEIVEAVGVSQRTLDRGGRALNASF
ncbi:MAG: hypothetical protein AAGL49_06535 [Pseudomonadota bacterium]